MLLTTKVPRALETKAKLFGFELSDLLLIFLYLSIANLFFGGTRLKFLFVWVGTLSLSAFLHFVKRGKPESFIQDYTQYLLSPHILTAPSPDLEYEPYKPCQGVR